MKGLITGATLTVVLAAAGPASATHGDNGQGKRDFAVGAGSSEFALGAIGEASFSLSAHSDPFGARPGGYITSKGDPDGIGPLEPFTAKGEVTCLRVKGNRASLKWRFERTTGSAATFAGGGVQSFVEDNGPPRGGMPLDRAALDPPQPAGVFESNAAQCDDPDTRAHYDRIESGNITVHDATGD